MPTDTFWSNPGNLNPPQGVITLNSPGDLQPGPVGHIPGTASGALPSAYTTAARTVYPWNFDYADSDRLAEYNSLVSTQFGQFISWHSLYQARYISSLPSGSQFVSIPASPAPNTAPDAYFIVLADNRTVVNLMSLTLSSFQQLSQTDRDRITNIGVFATYMAPTLGLVTRGSTQDTVSGAISTLRNLIATDPPAPAIAMSALDKKVFTDQLDIIERRYTSNALVAVETVNAAIGALTERFTRAKLFANIRSEVSLQTSFVQNGDEMRVATLFSDVKGYAISSDNGQTASSGYAAFMRSERELLSAQLRREAISKNTTTFDPKRDVAQLIYELQLLYQSEAEARADGGTEEMAQLHRLLSDYAIMQRLVNETLKAYNPKSADEKRRFMNLGAEANGNVDSGTGTQRTRDGGEYVIQYRFDDGVTFVYPTNGGWFSHSPAYHWYMLAGTQGNARIGDGVVYEQQGNDNFRSPLDYNNDGSIIGDVYAFYRPDEGNPVVLSGGLTEAEMRVLGMFSADSWGSGDGGRYQGHPIEELYNIGGRPRQKLSDDTTEGVGSLALQRRDYWDKWSTQLADTVTILNQKNQLKQNEIDTDTKQGNRHFDLGTNALRKMNEMLMSIGRM